MINGLTDLLHPCQVMADLSRCGRTLGGWEGKTVAWIGDGNNMANSWIDAAGTLGFELRLACPEGYAPTARSSSGPKVTSIVLTEDPREAAQGAHVVNTDVWASMGQEEEQEAGPRLPGLHRGRAADAVADRGDLPALPAGPSRRGSDGRRHRRPAVAVGMRPKIGCTCRRRLWRR